MALNVPIFNAVAPEYVSVDTTRRDIIAEQAELQIFESKWGDRYDIGVAYLTAHMLKMGDRFGRAGSVSSEKVGDLQRSYSGGEPDDELDETAYGKEYKRLRRMFCKTPLIS